MIILFVAQMALVEEAGAGAAAAADDPEALLNEWLGELTVLTAVNYHDTYNIFTSFFFNKATTNI